MDKALFFSFRISLPGTGRRPLVFQQRSSAQEASDARAGGISYSGHTHALYGSFGGQRIFPPEMHPARVVVEIPDGLKWDWAHIAPYSGGLTYITKETLVLCYFE